jgi:hypothetical protein
MTVQVYRSTDYGSPILNTANTALPIALFTACLVDGYGTQTPSSLTQVAGLATCTLPVAHGFPIGTNQNLLISGYDQANYNGNKTITSISPFSFTFSVDSGTVSPATGASPTTKVPGAGWTKPYTNSTTGAIFRQGGGQQRVVQIDATTIASGYGRIIGAESASAWNTLIAPFPTNAQVSGGLYIQLAALSTSVPWILVADDKLFYFFVNPDNSLTSTNGKCTIFGDIIPSDPGDIFATIISSANTTTNNIASFATAWSQGESPAVTYVARRYGGIGTSRLVGRMALAPTNPSGYGTSTYPYPFPNGIDGSLHYTKVLVGDPLGVRGTIPGSVTHLHLSSTFTHNDSFLGSGVDTGKCFTLCNMSGSSSIILETSNTWYS